MVISGAAGANSNCGSTGSKNRWSIQVLEPFHTFRFHALFGTIRRHSLHLCSIQSLWNRTLQRMQLTKSFPNNMVGSLHKTQMLVRAMLSARWFRWQIPCEICPMSTLVTSAAQSYCSVTYFVDTILNVAQLVDVLELQYCCRNDFLTSWIDYSICKPGLTQLVIFLIYSYYCVYW